MLTIRHITIGGEEEIRQAEGIRYMPSIGGAELAGTQQPSLMVFVGKGEHTSIWGGTIFVMNDNGKTVARYDLGASPVPIIGDGLSDPRPRGAAQPVAA